MVQANKMPNVSLFFSLFFLVSDPSCIASGQLHSQIITQLYLQVPWPACKEKAEEIIY